MSSHSILSNKPQLNLLGGGGWDGEIMDEIEGSVNELLNEKKQFELSVGELINDLRVLQRVKTLADVELREQYKVSDDILKGAREKYEEFVVEVNKLNPNVNIEG